MTTDFGSRSAAFPRAGRRHWMSAVADLTLGGAFRGPEGVRCTCESVHEERRKILERPVFFVFRAGTSSWGSVRMRVFQMASGLRLSVAKKSLVKTVTDFQLANLAPHDADIVMSKYLLQPTNFRWFSELRSRGNRVFADLVDGFPVSGLEEEVDGFLCASRSEFLFRRDSGIKASEVLHPVDFRLKPGGFDRDTFDIGYLGGDGGALHIELIPEIQKVVTALTLTRREVWSLSKSVRTWSHHYSVRTFFGDGVFKPATKAFVAARFGAVFIGSRQDVESVVILGENYPYLAQSSSRDDILEVIGKARATFRGPEWNRAVQVMTDLKRETCDRELGDRLAETLRGP